MNPWLLAFSTIGAASFLAGFFIRPFVAGFTLTKENILMAVFAELQPPLADLDVAVAELPAKVAAAVSAGDRTSVQDKADTIAAVQSSAKATVDAINAIGGA
ncbi:MAG: hypothetical protein ACXWKM_13485 [Phenylobacterium sp.]